MSHPLLEQINDKVFSVPEYLELINELISPLRVSVEGEITDLKILREWVFFSLKDAESGALLRCGLHAQAYRRLGVTVEEGMKVKVEGYGKISPKTGNFGFWVSAIEPVGEGALRRAYELLVKKLREEGLYERKRDIPAFISHIGVISSRDGVVLQDLRKNLKPLGIRIDFVHSGVEGAASAGELARAIRFFSKTQQRPDVLVLIRGGGSLESLQGFNNEDVCRALYAAPMPVLVGIGHDVDAPIATMVADMSASTPTAVATVINSSWNPLTEGLPRLMYSIRTGFVRTIEQVRNRARFAAQTMRQGLLHVLHRFSGYEQALLRALRAFPVNLGRLRVAVDDHGARIADQLEMRIEAIRMFIVAQERLQSAHDPLRVLGRGYSIVYREGKLVRSVSDVSVGAVLETQLSDGVISSEVTHI